MPSIFDIAKPLIDKGTSLAGPVLNRLPFPGGGGGAKPVTDTVLKQQVEAALYRVPGVSRSKVKVTVAEGRVTLHGEVRNQGHMRSAEAAVIAVPGVTGYESQLHLPKTPAPSTPAAKRRSTTKKPAAATKAATRGRTERVNRDKTSGPKPADLAAKRAGRPAAPMGSQDAETPSTTPDTGTATPGGTQADSPVGRTTSGS
jgi:hypothetical protein